MLKEKFTDRKYADVAGLCKVATRSEIERRLEPESGALCGVAEREADDLILRSA